MYHPKINIHKLFVGLVFVKISKVVCLWCRFCQIVCFIFYSIVPILPNCLFYFLFNWYLYPGVNAASIGCKKNWHSVPCHKNANMLSRKGLLRRPTIQLYYSNWVKTKGTDGMYLPTSAVKKKPDGSFLPNHGSAKNATANNVIKNRRCRQVQSPLKRARELFRLPKMYS